MTKRLMVLVAMLAMLLVAALPALGQEEEPAPAQEEAPPPEEPVEGPPGPSPETTATLTFELTVKGEPPEGTTFLGFIPAEGGISVPLTDPDGDGIYTGSTVLDRFGPGPRPVPPDIDPVSLPVQIVQQNGENTEVIRDFGVVPLDGDKTFRARVNFKRDRGETTTPGDPGSDFSTPGPVGTGDPTDPETGEDVNQDGLIDQSDGEVAAAVSDAAIDAAKSSSEPTLPATGGPVSLTLFIPGLTGLILAVSGLLARRPTR